MRMLLRSQLEELARTFTRGNAGHMEKVYLQDIVLHSIYREVVDELVFKGGTALHRFYNLDRFSEDLDFTATKEIDLVKLLESAGRQLRNFGTEAERIQSQEEADSFMARFGIRGPLYAGNELSLGYLRIEVNKGAEAETPVLKRYAPHFPDIPAFEIVTLTAEEILAEKIRALSTRTQARDLYDTYHLLQRGTRIDVGLVAKKLSRYHLEYDPATLLGGAEKARKSWEYLESLTYSRLPEFEVALGMLKASIESSGKG
jgi:predicted nucleotidyltransferase component of viral defense system